MLASQFSSHCDVISNQLWRHQNENRANDTRGRSVKIVNLIVIHGFVNNKCMHSRDELFMRSLECYFGVYFPRHCATPEINTKITHQFATRANTLYIYIYIYIWLGGPTTSWRVISTDVELSILAITYNNTSWLPAVSCYRQSSDQPVRRGSWVLNLQDRKWFSRVFLFIIWYRYIYRNQMQIK